MLAHSRAGGLFACCFISCMAAAAAAAGTQAGGILRIPPSRPRYAVVADQGQNETRTNMTGPVFRNEPWPLSRYGARRGSKAVQLPPGAHDVHLQLKQHEGFVFGTAFQPEFIDGDDDLEWYLNHTRTHFNALVPENRFKWHIFEPKQGEASKSQDILDQQYIAFARGANFSLTRGHTLQWSLSEPSWVKDLDCEAFVAALMQRVERDVRNNRGKFEQYDVFNEIIEKPGKLETCNLWDTAFPDAFKLAHKLDPTAKLCINDLSLIEAHNAPRLIEIVKNHVWAHGAPIHCIGIQAHFEQWGVNLTHQQIHLDLLATLGLDLIISEYSLFSTWLGPQGNPISYLDEGTAANTTVELFRLWFSHPAVRGILVWGWWDKNMWVTNAGLYDANKRPKAAAHAIDRLWRQELSTRVHVALPHAAIEALDLEPELQLPITSATSTHQAPAAAAAASGGPWVAFDGFHGQYEYSYRTAAGALVTGTVDLGKSTPKHKLGAVWNQQ